MSEFPQDILDNLIDDLDAAVFITDVDGIVHYLNEPASFIVRLPRITALGRTLERLLPQDMADFLTSDGRETLATGRINLRTTRSFIVPGRGLRFYDVRIIPYRRLTGGPWIAYLLMDITNRERREMASERARENAEAEARARRAFLARMSHEIRTPMNGIMGMTELAMQSEDAEETVEYLGVIKNAADSLLGIINDVLDFSRVESGRLELENIPFAPAALLEEILVLLKPTSEGKEVELTGTVAAELPEKLMGDPIRIRQIVTNLVGNALKFTEKGSVHVHLETGKQSPDGEGEEIILIGSVRDTGIGIEEDKIRVLFEPFAQNSAATGREYGGTGLGLAICRTLCRLMGGEIDAESRPGEGSVFRFRIHLRKLSDSPKIITDTNISEGELKKSRKTPVWNGETVLLAEDNRINRIVAEGLLKKASLNFVSCENGEEAVEAWKKLNPDLILMDLQMPVLDGTGASVLIRESEIQGGKKRVPIVALTAHVLEEEKQAAEDAGMDGWVTKPVKPAELYAELARFLPPVVFPQETPRG